MTGVQTCAPSDLYRTQEEIAQWKEKDPIAHMKNYLLDNALSTKETIAEIEERALHTVDEAVAFAQSSPFPSPDGLKSRVYA